MRDNREKNYNNLEILLDREKGKNICLSGDWNARTAEEGRKIETDNRELRNSKDKVINKEGKELITWLRRNGLQISNGNINGDEEGRYTYVGARGSTVIDYGIMNEEMEEMIEKMEIKESIESDHGKMIITVEGSEEEGRKNKREYIERICWKEEDIESYRKKLSESLEQKTEGWKELKEKIQEALIRKKVLKAGKQGTENRSGKEWWDRECKEKKEVKKFRVECNTSGAFRESYMRMRKEYIAC